MYLHVSGRIRSPQKNPYGPSNPYTELISGKKQRLNHNLRLRTNGFPSGLAHELQSGLWAPICSKILGQTVGGDISNGCEHLSKRGDVAFREESPFWIAR